MYGMTWHDMGTTPPRVAWQMIRALRSAPPGLAGTGERKDAFVAALEQAEQLLTAARDVGVATRPILAFYGLSQAGRALAAAGRKEPDWRLRGHGIQTVHVSDLTESGVSDVVVQDSKKSGAFIKVAAALGSASLPDQTRLGSIWPLLPETWRFPLPGTRPLRALNVTWENAYAITSESTVRLKVGNLPGHLLTILGPGADPSVASGTRWQDERVRVADFLASYPSLRDFRFTTPRGNPVGLRVQGPDACEANLDWTRPLGATDREFLAGTTVGYRGERLAFPSIGGSQLPSHPLLVWWATLYALSTLARYEPEHWAAITSVNTSADAAAVEHLMNEALIVLPELIHQAITEACG